MSILSNVTSWASDAKDKVTSAVSGATSSIGNWLNSTYNNTNTASVISTPSTSISTSDTSNTSNSSSIYDNASKTTTNTNTPTQYSSTKAYETDKAKTTTVENIQKSLNTLGYTYGDEGELKIDGDFGIKTQSNWDNFISDLGVTNYLAGIGNKISDNYTEVKNWATTIYTDMSNKISENWNNYGGNNALDISNNSTTADQKYVLDEVINQISNNGVDIDAVYSAKDVRESWREYEELTYYLTDDKNSDKALAALSNAQGVRAEEIVFGIAGETFAWGVAMDANGQETKYYTRGSAFLNNPDNMMIFLNAILGAEIELTASTNVIYYNAPIDAVVSGSSETFGGTAIAVGFDYTWLEYEGENYSGISYPNRLGYGMGYSYNETKAR